MRPDEHKKKRSAQYKKKHGVQAAKGDDGRKNDKQTTRDEGVSQRTQAAVTRNPNVKSEISKGDEDDQFDAAENPRSFSKRTVQSNWERYELSDHGSSDEERGADFNVLLSFAGSSSSYRQLESEKEWGDADTSEFSSLALDYQDLEAEFKDLPFCEKYKLGDLGLNSDILEYIKTLSDESFTSETQPLDMLSQGVTDDLGFDFSSVHKAVEHMKDTTEVAEYVSETQASEGVQTDDTTYANVRLTPTKANGSDDSHGNTNTSGSTVTDPKNSDLEVDTHTEVLAENNDHTDSDLPHDSRETVDSFIAQTNISTISQPSIPSSTNKTGTQLDDEVLDDLLSMTSNSSTSTAPKEVPSSSSGCTRALPAVVHAETKKPASEEGNDPDADDLESWLDSVL